jgi:hypothetical protein
MPDDPGKYSEDAETFLTMWPSISWAKKDTCMDDNGSHDTVL